MVVVVACAGAVWLGWLGGRGERFDAKQVTISPAGGDALRIREVVDQDFGTNHRHGYERVIPDDFGVPTDVVASSLDADGSVEVSSVTWGQTRIRVGSPDRTFTGQHRYTLEYTLPDARLSSGVLNLDVIDAGETLETGRFEVIVVGFRLDNIVCSVGRANDVGGCELEPINGGYRVVFAPLRAGDGITVLADITGYVAVTLPPPTSPPPRVADHRLWLSAAVLALGLAGATAAYWVLRQRGRNDVIRGGAADAAYGPRSQPAIWGPPGSTSPTPLGDAEAAPLPGPLIDRVSDAALASMATIEFVPPRGLDPWHGAVLLDEAIDARSASAWLSGLAASDVITLTERTGALVLGSGPTRAQLDRTNASVLDALFNGRDEVTLGAFDPAVARAWATILRNQAITVKALQWWRRGTPRVEQRGVSTVLRTLAPVAVILAVMGARLAAEALPLLQSTPAALAVAVVVPSLVALAMYAPMLPARSATGSACALLTESFRRFLVASEGRHVEWAWQQGVLREYSAWAVSLGAADAWGKALQAANVPDTARRSSPLLIHTMAPSLRSTTTRPNPSGGRGGGGVSAGRRGGGRVGGGGGGGRSGSW